jgi:hypothetical protein
MPYPIALLDLSNQEAKEEIINETSPIWRKDPST